MSGPKTSRDSRQRFEASVRRQGEHLIWIARTNRYGTGRLKVWDPDAGRWRETPARRVAWELSFGAVPAGKNVADTCGIAACVEPSHLALIDRGATIGPRVARSRADVAALYPDAVDHARSLTVTDDAVAAAALALPPDADFAKRMTWARDALTAALPHLAATA